MKFLYTYIIYHNELHYHQQFYINIYIYCSVPIYIQGVSKPMSQTFPGYSPPQNKQKSFYQHGSKNEQVPRYRLTFMCWYPFEYHIRCSKC